MKKGLTSLFSTLQYAINTVLQDRDFKGILVTLISFFRWQFVWLSVLVPVVGRHDALMQSFGPQTEGFQLGIDKLGKRRTVAFYGQKRQVIDISQHTAKLPVVRVGGYFILAVHGFVQDGFRQPVGHATEGADGDHTA